MEHSATESSRLEPREDDAVPVAEGVSAAAAAALAEARDKRRAFIRALARQAACELWAQDRAAKAPE
jgi:hypothetical protein